MALEMIGVNSGIGNPSIDMLAAASADSFAQACQIWVWFDGRCHCGRAVPAGGKCRLVCRVIGDEVYWS